MRMTSQKESEDRCTKAPKYTLAILQLSHMCLYPPVLGQGGGATKIRVKFFLFSGEPAQKSEDKNWTVETNTISPCWFQFLELSSAPTSIVPSLFTESHPYSNPCPSRASWPPTLPPGPAPAVFSLSFRCQTTSVPQPTETFKPKYRTKSGTIISV